MGRTAVAKAGAFRNQNVKIFRFSPVKAVFNIDGKKVVRTQIARQSDQNRQAGFFVGQIVKVESESNLTAAIFTPRFSSVSAVFIITEVLPEDGGPAMVINFIFLFWPATDRANG